MRYILSMLAMVWIVQAAVLLTNGEFEQPLAIGWEQSIQGQTYGDTIDRSIYFDPDPDYEVRVKKFDGGYAKVHQTVNIATTDLQFSISAHIEAREFEPESTRWATASVVLEYRNSQHSLLGETRICHNSLHCPYVNTPTFHMIEVIDSINWYTYSFNIDDELQNLPGISPDDIAKITVAMYDTSNGC